MFGIQKHNRLLGQQAQHQGCAKSNEAFKTSSQTSDLVDVLLDQRLTSTFSILSRAQGAAKCFLDMITKPNHVATFNFIEKESFVN
ncbi:hypothetical protein BUE80_DR005259 [Diplocarpon rosae]|nr:hypothetical protein BUE80_DR005259 [Diplocarpon rosae]